jgi:hypothetical protein
VWFCFRCDRCSKEGELAAGFRHAFANTRADLDLTAQELRSNAFAEHLPALPHEGFGRIGEEVAAFKVNEEVFLLNADRRCLLTLHPVRESCGRQES